MLKLIIYSLGFKKKSTVLYCLLKFLAILCQIIGMVLVFNYISVIMGNVGRYRFVKIFFNYYPNFFLYLFPVVVGLVIFLPYLLRYVSKAYIVNCMVKIESEMFECFLKNLALTRFIPLNSPFGKNEITRLLNSDLRYFSRFWLSLLDCIIPFITAVVLAVLLLYYFFFQTIIIMSLTMIFIFLYIMLSRRVSNISSYSDKCAPLSNSMRVNLLNRVLQRRIDTNEFYSSIGSISNNFEVNDFLKNYGHRLKINDQMQLLVGGFLATILAILIFYIGYNIKILHNTFIHVVEYIIGINYFFLQLKQLATASTRLRFFQGSARRCKIFSERINNIVISCIKKDNYNNCPDIYGWVCESIRELDKQNAYVAVKELGINEGLDYNIIGSLEIDGSLYVDKFFNYDLAKKFAQCIGLDNISILDKVAHGEICIAEEWDKLEKKIKLLFLIHNSNQLLICNNLIFKNIENNTRNGIKTFFNDQGKTVIVFYKNKIKNGIFSEKIYYSKFSDINTAIDDNDDIFLTDFD